MILPPEEAMLAFSSIEQGQAVETELKAGVDQVSEAELAWLEARRGKITGSMVHLLMGKGRAQNAVFTDQGLTYLRRLVAEQLGSSYGFTASATEWGKQYESEAIEAYQAATGIDVDSEPFRFIAFTDGGESLLSGLAGSTPDGICDGGEGVVEVKCPKDPANHIEAVMSQEIPSKSSRNYIPQCDSHLLFTDAEWVDFVSFDPRMPSDEPSRLVVIRRTKAEAEASIDKLRERCELAADWIIRTMADIRSRQAVEEFARLAARKLSCLGGEDRARVAKLFTVVEEEA